MIAILPKVEKDGELRNVARFSALEARLFGDKVYVSVRDTLTQRDRERLDDVVRAAAGAARVFFEEDTFVFAARSVTDAYEAGLAHPMIVAAVQRDFATLEAGGSLFAERLFLGDPPEWFVQLEKQMRSNGSEIPDRWDFWLRWWEGIKSGNPIDPALQLAIVQGLDDETWQDPDATARRIAEIEAQYFDGLGASSTGEGASKVAVPYAAVAEAMTRNRRELPAATGAVLGFIELEVERLQAKNYQSEEEAQESRHQIRVLQTIHEAVAKLEVLIPDGVQMNEADAVEAEKLMQLVVRRFKEWPRNKPGHCEDNAADLADTVIRCALVGAATQMLILIGAHASVAVGVSGALFGGKKIIEAIKAGPAQVG
ncbi:MAG: hypothetical protein N4A53_01775 [Pelagimonas sp.]|jgi:hypothetical protein|nr:hypothetical protein [Pelagimonas sp.]